MEITARITVGTAARVVPSRVRQAQTPGTQRRRRKVYFRRPPAPFRSEQFRIHSSAMPRLLVRAVQIRRYTSTPAYRCTCRRRIKSSTCARISTKTSSFIPNQSSLFKVSNKLRMKGERKGTNLEWKGNERFKIEKKTKFKIPERLISVQIWENVVKLVKNGSKTSSH